MCGYAKNCCHSSATGLASRVVKCGRHRRSYNSLSELVITQWVLLGKVLLPSTFAIEVSRLRGLHFTGGNLTLLNMTVHTVCVCVWGGGALVV